jgi:hypothetical protein
VSVSPSEIRAAAARALYSRSSDEIVEDLRAVSRVLLHELDTWNGEPLTQSALITAETSAEGIRRLLQQLRLSVQNRAEVG